MSNVASTQDTSPDKCRRAFYKQHAMLHRDQESCRSAGAGPLQALYLCGIALLCLLLCALPVRAQVDLGTITGTITDATGAIIPGVEVAAVNHATGQVYKAVTDGAGIYNLVDLPIATYEVTYSKPGFSTFVQKGVAIQVEQKAQINVQLRVGSKSQTVTVTGAPLLKLNTQLGTNLTSQDVTSLPLTAYQGRDITSFAYSITPTVTGTDYQGQIGGSQSSTKEVLIDGTSADSSRTGFVGILEPPMDAVGQFQVDTSGISAAEGRTGGGVLQFELKQGTNHIHGTAFYIFTNKNLDANTWENNYFRSYYTAGDPANAAKYAAQYARPTNTYEDWGVSGGLPIWKNHMFAYVAFERYHQANFTTTEGGATVPTAAFLQGDFSQLLNSNALAKDECGNKIYQGAIWNPTNNCVFPGNIIPQNMLSPTSLKVASIYEKYYAPTIPTRDVLNYPKLNEVDPLDSRTQFSIDYTWDLSPTNKINTSYIFEQNPRYNAGLQSGSFLWQTGSQTGGPLASGGLQTTNGHAYRINDTWTVSPNLLNVLAYTFNQLQNGSTPLTSVAGNTNWAQTIGLGAYQTVPNFPLVDFGAVFNGVGEAEIGSTRTPHTGYNSYNGILDDTVTWMHGRHLVNIGFEARALGINSDNRGGALSFTFSRLTGQNLSQSYADTYTGSSFANFMMGDVYSADKGTEFNQYGRRKEFAFFAEDSYRVTPKLTLDYALRWDIPLAEHELYGHWSNFTTTASNPNFGSHLGSMQYLSSGGQTFETNNDFKQFSPHFGGSYAATKRLVLRGDFGVYYVPLGNNTYGAVPYSSSYGYEAINQVTAPIQTNLYAFSWDNGYPGTPVTQSADNNSSFVPVQPTSVSPDTLKMGYTENWNIDAQYQVSRTVVLHASYIGNIGRRLHDGALDPYNWPTWAEYSKLYNTGGVQDFISNAAQASALGIAYPYPGWTGDAYEAINPYPQSSRLGSPILFVNTPLGQSGYNALVLEVTSRSSHGLSMDLSYTRSKVTGNTTDAFIETDSATKGYQDPYQYKYYSKFPEAGYSPQQLKGFVVYNLPFGRGQRFLNHNRLLNFIVGGWVAATIVNVQSGATLGAVHADAKYPGWSAVWANVAPNANFKNTFKKLDLINLQDPSNSFVDTSNFTNPPNGQLGNSPVSFANWHGWASNDEDVSLQKQFKVGPHGRYVMTLRAEFFNVTNRHQYANPNQTIGNINFGRVTGIANTPRQGQLGARFSW